MVQAEISPRPSIGASRAGTPLKRHSFVLGLLVNLAIGLVFTALPTNSAQAADDGEPPWGASHREALEQGSKEGKPIILDLWADWCVACKDLAKTTFPHASVAPLLDGFVLAKIDMDAKENADLWGKYKVSSLPQVFFLKPDGTLLSDFTLSAFEAPDAFAARLLRAREALGFNNAAEAPTPEPTRPTSPAALPTTESPAPDLADDDLADVIRAVSGNALARTPQVNARLLANSASVVAGETFWLGVHLHVRKGWHIYWKHPGDSGRATEISLRTPEAITGDPRWPQPIRFEERGDLITYGYANQVLIPVPISLAAEAITGDTVDVRAQVSWLVCKDNCVPGSAELSARIAVGSTSERSPCANAIEAALATSAQSVPAGIAVTPKVHGEQDSAGPLVVQLELQSVRGALSLGEGYGKSWPLAVWADPPLEVSHREVRIHEADGKLTIDIPVAPIPGAGGPTEAAVHAAVGLREGRASTHALASHTVKIAGGAEAAAGLPTMERAPKTGFSPLAAPSFSLWQMLLFAFIGGIILNVMPCVLPVLSLKAMSIVKQAGENPRVIWHHGLAYGAGVLVSFLALALVVVGLKTSGELVGWGFQMQNPYFVLGLCALVFGFSLSMFGVYEITPPATDLAHRASSSGGLSGSFANGAFATLLATPCTAPFLGPAMGFAFSQPSAIIVLMFLVVGAGLALPFVLLARYPAWIRKIPRGGDWMDTFKHIMGFLLIATTVWLLDVLSHHVSPRGLIGVIAFLGIIAVGAWMYGRFAGFTASPPQRTAVSLAATALVAAGAWLTVQFDGDPGPSTSQAAEAKPGDIEWKPFSPDLISNLQSDGQTVFIDFTAAWCVTCKANENAVIDTEEVRGVLRELNVVSVKADFTKHDENIAEWLRRYDRVGVPLYVILPGEGGKEPIVLPELLTSSLLIEALRAAGPSKQASSAERASL